MAKRIEDLPIFQRATEFCVAVTALLDRPAFCRDWKTRSQISEASDSVTSNMCEGFEQPTDDAFSHYLYVSKGSVAEILTRLATAEEKGYISAPELASFTASGEALGKMLGGFIKYRARPGFKDRGRYRAKQERRESTRRTPKRPRKRTDSG
jgi:four helix bundle protein